MPTDPIDELLDRSAPALADRGAGRDAALHQMARDARDTVRPTRRPRRRTGVIAAALSGALLLGGGGAAIAAGLVDWPAGFQDPDSSFAFSLPSGRACEVRLIVAELDPEAAEGENHAQQEVDRWLNEVDLQSELDLAAAELDAERIFAEQRDAGQTILIDDEGWLTDAPVEQREATPDDEYAFMIDRAVRSALRDHLTGTGIPEQEWTFGADGGVKCAAE